MKRTCIVLIALFVVASAVSAQTTLVVTRNPGDEALNEIDRRFMEQNPDIKIEVIGETGGLQFATAGGEGLIVQIAGGLIPDVALMADATIGRFAAAGVLTDLTDMIEDMGGIDPFWPAAWEAVRLNGRYWGVPFVTDTRALNYNVDTFASAGFGEPPRTLEELDEMASKLTISTGEGAYEQFGFWPRGGNWWLWGWGWLFGGSFFDEAAGLVTANHPRIVEALEYEVSYVERYQAGAGSFCEGTLAMQIDVSTAMNHYLESCPSLNYMTVPVPPPQGRESVTWSGIWVWAMPKGGANPEAAWRYLQYLMSPEAQTIRAVRWGEIPTNFEANRGLVDVYVDRFGEPGRVFLDLVTITRVRPVLAITNEYWNELEIARDRAYKLEATPQAALDEATRKLQALYEESLSR